MSKDEMWALLHDAFNDVLIQVSKSGASANEFLAIFLRFCAEEVANGVAQSKEKFTYNAQEADEIATLFCSVFISMMSKRLLTMHEDVKESLH